jgi:hypothetical protein
MDAARPVPDTRSPSAEVAKNGRKSARVRSLARRCSASIHSWMRNGATAQATRTSAHTGKPAIRIRFLLRDDASPYNDGWTARRAKFLAAVAALTLLTLFTLAALLAIDVASVKADGSTNGSSVPTGVLVRSPKNRPSYDIRVAADVANGRLDLHVVVDLPLAYTAPILWLYADRQHDVPPSFDEFEAERIFPTGIARGGYEQVVVTVEGCPPQRIDEQTGATPQRSTRGRDVPITVCGDAVRPLQLDVVTTLNVANRFGTLGVTRDTMTLGDPWYPLVLPSPDALVPDAADHSLHVAPLDARIVATAEGAQSVDEAHPVAVAEQRAVTHAPLVLLPIDKTYQTDRFDGVDLTLLTDHPELATRSPLGPEDTFVNESIFDTDAAGYVHGTVRESITFLRRLGFVAAPPDEPRVRGLASRLVIVEVPERQRLAVDVPGMLLVSDRAFRIFPVDRVRRLHALQIARRAFDALIAPHLLATSLRAQSPWIADVAGSYLADELVEVLTGQAGKKETARDLVKAFGFHPAVDQLLYAPHVAFGASLFGALEEPDPDRNGVDRARNLLPMGRFVVEKLRDRLGPTFALAMKAHLQGLPLIDAAQANSSEDLGYFWKQWIGPHRPVAYRIVEVTEVAGVRTEIVIERQGTTWLREPVVVEVLDEDGHRVRGTWDAPGARGTITVTTPAPFDEAQLDPDGRLAQDPTIVDGHPQFDDETSHTWKPPVFASFSASYAAAERRLDFDVNFALRRRYDVDHGYALQTFQNARGFGAAIRYLRVGTWALGIGADRSPKGFGASSTPVSEVSLLASIFWDTTRQLQDPMTGASLLLTATGNIAREDGGRTSPNVILGARGRMFFWEHVRTTSVLVAGAGLVLGPALETQLLGLAGRQFLRAFEADEAIGKSRAYVIFEQRFRAITGVYVSGGPGTWFKGLELVPWIAGGAASSSKSAIDFSGAGRFLAEVGFGTRLLHEYGGVQPATFSIDLAYPIGRVDDCARIDPTSGACARTRQQLGFWVGFEQTM